jgi:DNA-binding Xre family transcriptional regulator
MRVIGFEWRLRELMAAKGLFSTTKLIPLLEDRGVRLSSSQVYRLAAEKPERLNLNTLVALMDIFDCTADDLIQRVKLGQATAATGTDDRQLDASPSTVLRSKGLRPRRAEIEVPLDD